MARIRSVHPELCTDEGLAEVSASAERTFVRLWPHLDDEGRTRDNIRLIKAACYPLHDDVTSADVETDLIELASAGLIIRYQVDGDRFLTAKPASWTRWQKPRHFYPSKLPAPAHVGCTSDVGPTTAGLELRGEELSGRGAAAVTSDARPTDVRLTQQQRQQIIDQAVSILTDRHLAHNPTTSGKPQRHRIAVHNGKLTDHQQTAHAMLAEQPLTAEQLANLLEPTTAPKVGVTHLDELTPGCHPPPPRSHEHCQPPCDGHGWIEHDEGVSPCPGPIEAVKDTA